MIKVLWQRWRGIPWKWRWAVFTTALIVTFYSIENFRGWYALNEYREKWEAKGEWFSLQDRPRAPLIPEGDNLLAYPAVIEALSSDGGRFSLKSLGDLRFALATADRNRGRHSCRFFPFEDAFESVPRLTRLEGANRYLSEIEEWKEGLDQFCLAVANERFYLEHGKYPDRLEELVPGYLPLIPTDHFPGKPMRYMPAGERSERPVIYSFGRNEIDDGGYPARNKRHGDLVWQYDFPEWFSFDDFYDSKIP